MKKVAINCRHSGFSLSPFAIEAICKKKGIPCYFFRDQFDKEYKLIYVPCTVHEAAEAFLFSAYNVPNPQDFKLDEKDADGLYKSANARAQEISIDIRPSNREDKDLIDVIEELGEKSWGKHSKLKIVQVPEDVKYTIEEYDGNEWVAEIHRTWS